MRGAFDDEDEKVERQRPLRDTELTLGTGTLLLLFLGLALVCGAFFGLGYEVGRGVGQPATSQLADEWSKGKALGHGAAGDTGARADGCHTGQRIATCRERSGRFYAYCSSGRDERKPAAGPSGASWVEHPIALKRFRHARRASAAGAADGADCRCFTPGGRRCALNSTAQARVCSG